MLKRNFIRDEHPESSAQSRPGTAARLFVRNEGEPDYRRTSVHFSRDPRQPRELAIRQVLRSGSPDLKEVPARRGW
jgi:hypothetical protein